MKYKAILFDLDGTLLNTIDDLADSANAVLTNHKFKTHKVSDYIQWIGNGALNLLKQSLPNKSISEEQINEYLQEFKNEYNQRCFNKTKPYDHIPQALDAIVEYGFKLTVLSNKPDEYTKTMVLKLLNKWNFEVIYGERAGVPRKPNPAAAIEIANKINIPCSEFIYFGDSATDMQTAVAASMLPVGVLWGYKTKNELLQGGAKYIINTPKQIITLIKQLNSIG